MEKLRGFLADTNIWLERLLDQEKAQEVKQFLDIIPSEYISVSDFTVHSIGIILFNLKKATLFNEFIYDLFSRGGVQVILLNPFDQLDLAGLNKKFKLDFDDAYQHNLTEKYDLHLVSFDKDFKKSGTNVVTPAMAVEMYLKFSEK
jgi:uncharacterized protein